MVWPHDPEWLQNFPSYLNNLKLSINLTVKMELGSVIYFRNVLVIGKEMTRPPEPTEIPPTLANISTSVLTIRRSEKRFNSERSQKSFHHMSRMLRSL
jgi:hypothetical protein